MWRQSWRWRRVIRRGALGVLAGAGALGLTLALALAWATPAAHAAGGCGTTQSCIHWSSSMIYAGQNNGFPEGPVGEHASVTGEGFQTDAGKQYSLRLVKGDVNNTPDSPYEFCKLATPRVDGVATGITVDSGGNFSANFDWPAAASSGSWSVCAIGPDGFPAGSGNIDDGPFYVMSGSAPSLALSASTVNPGGSVTVTGQHWLPGQGGIFVYAGPCFDCGAPALATATVSSNASGAFTATLSFSGSATPGSYIVAAHTDNSVLDTMGSGPHITVALAPTATPAPTATVAATATTSGGGSSSAGGSSGVSSPPALVIALGALGLLALVGLIIGLVFLLRRPPSGPPPIGPGATPYPPYPPAAYPQDFTPSGPDDVTQPNLPPVGDSGPRRG